MSEKIECLYGFEDFPTCYVPTEIFVCAGANGIESNEKGETVMNKALKESRDYQNEN